jgi:hypothetical protein
VDPSNGTRSTCFNFVSKNHNARTRKKSMIIKLKYWGLGFISFFIISLIHSCMLYKGEEKVAAELGEGAHGYISVGFPLNYFEVKLKKGITTKSEAEKIIKGYKNKEEFPSEHNVVYYFESGSFKSKGILVQYDDKNIFEHIQYD